MGVYNPLVDMPNSCAECFTRGVSNCFLHQKMAHPNVLYSRHPDCPLVEIKPPHGRLIDAKAFETKNKYFWHRDFINAKYEDALCDLFDEAPTVLEAEGKDDG